MQCSGKLVLETHSLAIGGARWMNKREPGVCISFSTYSISISRFSSNRARMMKGPRSEYDSTGKKLRNSASFSSLPRRSTPPPLLLPLHSAYSLHASVHSTRAGKKWEKERNPIEANRVDLSAAQQDAIYNPATSYSMEMGGEFRRPLWCGPRGSSAAHQHLLSSSPCYWQVQRLILLTLLFYFILFSQIF